MNSTQGLPADSPRHSIVTGGFDSGDPQRHAHIVSELTGRWPENRVGPSLDRIARLCELLGSPQRSAPVIQITGTNGKGSTAIMIDALLRAMGLRTGRFSSPHLQDLTERICIDGQPIAPDRFDELWEQVEPLVTMVDDQRLDGIEMTFFEVMTGLAYAAFADAPVDVMIMEVGMGGRWDATNVADAQVAVVGPVAMDHMQYLGDTIAEIATEKAGIIKAGSTAVIAGQSADAARVLAQRCLEVGAPMVREGIDFGLLDRQPAVSGQLLRLDTASGPIGDIFLPLLGAHMAHNAALALASVEAFMGGKGLDPTVIEAGFGQVVAPARLETVHSEPTVVLDTAHNPHGVKATLEALREAFTFRPLIAVVAMMADKQVDQVLAQLETVADTIVVSHVSGSRRAMSVAELADLATGIFGANRVRTADDVSQALSTAMGLAEQSGEGAGVLVIGSVYLAGEVRDILVGHDVTTVEQPLRLGADDLQVGERRPVIIDADDEDIDDED
ncbi:bifunctional folylpolyglutamate synthase/dihydrofolate synthase [Propionibacterium freudenreichii]|uniref:bifunctional folylpolyglutamate synthase/dihydrofolate synthase n=1 Tax=Propionibacterium freudenreichii TaxID=1744 RepID=UPI0005A5CF22|nr:folylpolyglutamate synthase/dihydrofolate synthase family protein [Propionibacterium freudenreichii]MCT2991641.1 bifunctional folylpolyglutamate synthase/dihydrofolate synthase [Propionibacterium freudenreichii]MCT2994097.1 bifunctional folylpolyglutamate synthase/dihydrofolate synthase [Propionibacterium freudenreichii]MDK9651385.1 bifunctional folylpolyglutamate synthase/dihydrofolate synthase [Propionibacterium freudenreichii]MDK9664793.1 bifunctional folylpolyglutamate synthase/dihydrofo